MSIMLDIKEGRLQRDRAIELLSKTSKNAEWMAIAMEGAIYLSKHNPTWNSDQLWVPMDTHYAHVECTDRRVMGALQKHMVNAGIVAPIDKRNTVPSQRTKRHAGPVQVYTSLIYSGR